MVDIIEVIDEVKDVVSLSIIGSASSTISEFISDVASLTLTYAGSYSSPATHMLLLLRSVSKVPACLFHPKELTYYVAPYDEGREAKILIYVSPDGLTELNILSDQLRWTGHEFLIISPTQLPNVIRHRIPEGSLLDLRLEGRERYWLLLTHIINGLAIAKLLNMRGVRAKRVWSELSEIRPVVDNLLSYYEGVIRDVAEFLEEPTLITATPTMLGVAEYLAFSRDIRTQRFLVSTENVRNFIRFINRVLLIETDVEEYSVKEIKGLALTTASKVKELRLRTDPLTAPVYGLILARMIEYIHMRRGGR